MTEAYDGSQVVGIDLHRRRSMIVLANAVLRLADRP